MQEDHLGGVTSATFQWDQVDPIQKGKGGDYLWRLFKHSNKSAKKEIGSMWKGWLNLMIAFQLKINGADYITFIVLSSEFFKLIEFFN